MRLTGSVLATLIVASAIGASALQDHAQNPASVSGQVVDAVSRTPIPGAVVAFSADNGRSRLFSASTDDAGRFVWPAAPPGKYVVWASKAGFSGGYLGQRQPLLDGPPVYVQIVDGQRRDALELRLWQNGVVTGRVEDHAGHPLQGVTVEAFRRTVLAGRPQFARAPNAFARTDDRGIYRLFQLVPGDYILAARPSSQDLVLFFPDALHSFDAMVITIQPGFERIDTDFRKPRPGIGGVRVAGRVVGFTGARDSAQLRLHPVSGDGGFSEIDTLTTTLDRDGAFTFPVVPPGPAVIRFASYPGTVAVLGTVRVLQSRSGLTGGMPRDSERTPITPLPDVPTHWAELPILVQDQPMNDVILSIQKAARISGKVVFSGASRPDTELLPACAVFVLSADGRDLGDIPVGRIETDGAFRTAGLPAGKYVLSLRRPPPGWRLESMSIAGAESSSPRLDLGITDVSGVTLTLTDRPPARLTGAVRDERGQPSIDASVYVFPVDRAEWIDFGPLPDRLKVVRTNEAGQYVVDLPSGDYHAAVPKWDVPHSWMSADVLSRLSRSAATIRVGRSGTAVRDLVVR